ncbi:immunoglobulin-like domain-containing receptor 1b [Synchiropus picturatus]
MMGNLILMVLLLASLPTELLSIQVIVPETERSTTLFGSVILRCDYTTSANLQNVRVTWKFKSFCKDPVLEYYSTAYQAALQLGQDPSNDCPDRQRTIRTVIQKTGINEPILGVDYRERKITIRNKADLVITEVMWWDNGVYFCTVDADGDTTGDSDREIKLIVYHWLTVLLIILGALLLIILLCICCCQCCPNKCCCYVRCPCCPKTCCCPEKAVMQHRMMREARKAMAPWMSGQPIYAPIASNTSSQGVPILYSGSYSDYPTKSNFAMAPMQMAPLQQQQQPLPLQHHVNGSTSGSVQANNQFLDLLENQVRGLDLAAPPSSVPPPQNTHPMQLRPQPAPPAVPFTPGPPSMLSALDEMGVRGTERRVITLPPIIQRVPSFSRRGATGDRSRGGTRYSSQSSGSTNPPSRGFQREERSYRDTSPPRRGILREYSDESDWENRRGRPANRDQRTTRGDSAGRSRGGSRPRTRSRDNLLEELQSRTTRRQRSYSPQPGRGSWSSDEEDRRRRRGGKGKDWPEKPPSYSSIEIAPGHGGSRRHYDHSSDRSSRSGNSVVI